MSKKRYTMNGGSFEAKENCNGNLGTKEEEALVEFKNRIKDILKNDHDDFYLLKWLKARCFDVKKAEQMYRTSMLFRERMNIEKIVDNYVPPEVLLKYLTGGFLGHARDYSHLRIEPYGRLDIKGIMMSVKKSDLEKFKLQQCETTVRYWAEQSKNLDKRVDGLTVVFDMEGVSTRMLWRPGMQMYLHLVKLLEDNYPEMLTRLLVINAPSIFPLLYKLARPLISEDMKNKIHVLGGDYKEILLQYIDPSELPVCYGGNLTDPDGNPKCQSKICYGGDVPESYYLQNTDLLDHMKTITVPRGEKIVFQYDVTMANSVLSWEFKTEDYDIGFSVKFKDNSGNVTTILPMKRVNSHIVAEDGSILCDKKGAYIIEFDNTFSWTRSKKVMFSAEVLAPDDNNISTEINKLIESKNWDELASKFQTTHL